MVESNEIELAANIIAAYVHKKSVRPSDLPGLIVEVHGALVRLSVDSQPVVVEQQTPAVPIKKSVFPDFIICLENRKKFNSLKRHLRTAYDMTPEQYQAKWGLASDYPMVAPNYAAQRSAPAVSAGLGQQRRAKEIASEQALKPARRSSKAKPAAE